MVKKTVKKTKNVKVNPLAALNQMQALAHNALLRRRDLIRSLLDEGHDIDTSCGYPDAITTAMYREMYNRTGMAARVVNVWPDECFSERMEVYETEERGKTAFEKAWDDLVITKNIIHFLHRADRLSGIGQFGLLFFGVGDGKRLNEPVPDVVVDQKTGRVLGAFTNKYPLLYLRAFDEYSVQIAARNTNINSPRYGYPETYSVNFDDSAFTMVTEKGTQTSKNLQTVHWTRVVHIADNRECSEVLGIPRMQPVWNDLLNIRKTLGGSAEMFWRGGFPGIAFQMNNGDGTIDVSDAAKATMRDNIKDYFENLDRALLLENVEAKSLSPQVADPKSNFETQVMSLCATMGLPHRIFLGSEEAKMASTQDQKAWDRRVMQRQRNYLTPMVVRPVVDRLIAYGALPVPAQEYKVFWPDRAALTSSEMADVAKKETEAMAAYVEGGISQIITPKDFFVDFMHKTEEEATKFEKDIGGWEEDIMPPNPEPGRPKVPETAPPAP